MSAQGRDFWSRRKAMVAQEADALDEVDVPTEEISDEELLVALDLPDPDTLSLGDDIKGFMAKTVPDHLRRRALRRLWRLNPVLANVDGLVDYGDDFTDKATVVENLQTAYQIGKGMLTHVQEMARQAEEMIADDPEEAIDPTPVEDTKPAMAQVDTRSTAPGPVEYVAPRPRMRITYDQGATSASEA